MLYSVTALFNFQNYTDEDINICSPVISLKTKIVLTLKYLTLCPSNAFLINHYLFCIIIEA